MRTEIQLGLRHLKCLQPEDSADEPFAWVFYFTLDGTSIRQNSRNTDRLISNVLITGNPGSHGNLGVDEINPGQHFPIPASVNTYSSVVTPIRLNMLGQSLVIPARIGCFFVLLDEDATSDSAIETAHQRLRDFVQQRINGFIQDLSLNEILIRAGQLRSEQPNLALDDAAARALQEQIDAFTGTLVDQAVDLIEDVIVEESDIFELFDNWIDSDDLIGTFQFMPDERSLVQANLNMSFLGTVLYKPNDWRHWYDIGVDVKARLIPGSDEIQASNGLIDDSVVATGEFIIAEQQLCLDAGNRVGWQHHHLRERWDFSFNYPFLDVIWSIDGIELPGNRAAGTLDITKTVRKPRTDFLDKGISVPTVTEERQVTVRHERRRDNGIERLTVFNVPQDAQYPLTVGLAGVLPNGTRLPLGTSKALFDGQSVEVDNQFVESYLKCISKYDLPHRLIKRVTIKDLWGPYGRQKILDQVTQQLEVVADVRGLSAERRARLATAARQRLGLQERQ